MNFPRFLPFRRCYASLAHSSSNLPFLSPAVFTLVVRNLIDDATLLTIPKTGPKGRLIKGDVLEWMRKGGKPKAGFSSFASPSTSSTNLVVHERELDLASVLNAQKALQAKGHQVSLAQIFLRLTGSVLKSLPIITGSTTIVTPRSSPVGHVVATVPEADKADYKLIQSYLTTAESSPYSFPKLYDPIPSSSFAFIDRTSVSKLPLDYTPRTPSLTIHSISRFPVYTNAQLCAMESEILGLPITPFSTSNASSLAQKAPKADSKEDILDFLASRKVSTPLIPNVKLSTKAKVLLKVPEAVKQTDFWKSWDIAVLNLIK